MQVGTQKKTLFDRKSGKFYGIRDAGQRRRPDPDVGKLAKWA